MVCRSVQLWFPSTEMSGGQSAGGIEGLEAAAAVEREEEDEVAVEGGLDGFRDLVMAAHSANGVQVRHGFPSFPRTTPFGVALRGAGASPSPRSVEELLCGDDDGCDRLACSVKNFSIPFLG